MANRLEAIKDYLGSVANRTIGRQAWQEATKESSLKAPAEQIQPS